MQAKQKTSTSVGPNGLGVTGHNSGNKGNKGSTKVSQKILKYDDDAELSGEPTTHNKTDYQVAIHNINLGLTTKNIPQDVFKAMEYGVNQVVNWGCLEIEDKLLKLVKSNPRNANLWYCLGYCQSTIGYSGEAKLCFRKVIKIRPTCAAAWFELGCCLKKNSAGAIRAFRKATKLDPLHMEAFHTLAVCLWETGRRGEALTAAYQPTKATPRDSWAWEKTGYILAYSFGMKKQALECFTKAAEYGTPCPKNMKANVDYCCKGETIKARAA